MLAPHPTLTEYYESEATKRAFVRGIFDETAGDYDRVERVMALGTGPWYRRRALRRAGLAAGMRVLDVGTGTGLVAREEVAICGSARDVVGLDLSRGMLENAVRGLGIGGIVGAAEQMPVGDGEFDFVSMGYALRHVGDLEGTFREFHRVLRPGGRAVVLEITRPRGRVAMGLLKAYMKWVVPGVTRVVARSGGTPKLWRYYWETIETVVPVETVMAAMRGAGFADVGMHVELGMFTEFTGRKAG